MGNDRSAETYGLGLMNTDHAIHAIMEALDDADLAELAARIEERQQQAE